VNTERQMGEFLKAMPKNHGTAGAGRPALGGNESEPPKDETPTLREIGITKKQSSQAQKLADHLAEMVEAFNGSNDPAERVRSHESIVQLRKEIHDT